MNIDDAPFDFISMRQYMVESTIVKRGIVDDNVLNAMRTVPREYFVKPVDWDEAYDDSPLEIDCEQTISQPYIVALMSEMLSVEKGMKVLEVGTGSGYQSAILSAMGAKVFSVERHERLSRIARDALKRTGLINNITLKTSDGSIGWSEKAPFDRIILTCCAPVIPETLIEQLSSDNGVIVSPVDSEHGQILRKIIKSNGELSIKDDIPVRFVPLIGENGYNIN